jgi:hypothetical protein
LKYPGFQWFRMVLEIGKLFLPCHRYELPPV